MDPRVITRKYYPRNTPEEGIIPPLDTVIRRNTGQYSWQQKPSSHKHLNKAIQFLEPQTLQTEGRIAR